MPLMAAALANSYVLDIIPMSFKQIIDTTD